MHVLTLPRLRDKHILYAIDGNAITVNLLKIIKIYMRKFVLYLLYCFVLIWPKHNCVSELQERYAGRHQYLSNGE